MSGLPASNTPRLPARETVAGMGYRLAAGGLAGRLRVGDGGVGPTIEDAWVRHIARLWMDITRAVRHRDPAAEPPASETQAREAAAPRLRVLPVLALCQAAAAMGLVAIGSSTFLYWQKSHAAGPAPAKIQPVASLAAPAPARRAAARIRVADLQPQPAAPAAEPSAPIAAAPIVPSPTPAPAPEFAAAIPAPAEPAKPPARAPRLQTATAVVRPAPSAVRIAPAPRIFTVLATRPLPRPRRPVREAAAQIDMPHWLTDPPRAPRIMSEPPHDLTPPVQSEAPRMPPLLPLPHVDRFAAGNYVPPMMPGAYIYR